MDLPGTGVSGGKVRSQGEDQVAPGDSRSVRLWRLDLRVAVAQWCTGVRASLHSAEYIRPQYPVCGDEIESGEK
jgi:hypothetical protein